MNKKAAFGISIAVNIILALTFLLAALRAGSELKFCYLEADTIRPDTIRMYLDMENYGTAASLSHPIRGGAVVAAQDRDCFLLGEYADLLFLREIFSEAGNDATVKSCEDRLNEIRAETPDQGSLFDRIEKSVEKAISG